MVDGEIKEERRTVLDAAGVHVTCYRDARRSNRKLSERPRRRRYKYPGSGSHPPRSRRRLDDTADLRLFRARPHTRKYGMAAGAGKAKTAGGGVPALGWWLMAVGAVRIGLTWSGFFRPAALGAATFGVAPMTGVHGRTFGVWTLLSCTLCFLCAFDLGNRPLYAATFMSFVYAYAHFLVEYLVYNTTTAANLGTYAVVAVTSIVWMLLQWNSHAPRNAKQH
ncbi:hypothetical protein ACP70R_024727 [Stipagrostis hirtigluma subsp. patula]